MPKKKYLKFKDEPSECLKQIKKIISLSNIFCIFMLKNFNREKSGNKVFDLRKELFLN